MSNLAFPLLHMQDHNSLIVTVKADDASQRSRLAGKPWNGICQ